MKPLRFALLAPTILGIGLAFHLEFREQPAPVPDFAADESAVAIPEVAGTSFSFQAPARELVLGGVASGEGSVRTVAARSETRIVAGPSANPADSEGTDRDPVGEAIALLSSGTGSAGQWRRAVELLGASGDGRAYDALLTAYVATEDAELRGEILFQLEAYPVHEAADLARLYVASEGDSVARDRLADLLAREVRTLDGDVAGVLASLGELATDPELAGLLEASSPADDVALLSEVALEDPDPVVRLAALQEIADEGSGQAEELVRLALARDPAPEVRAGAAGLLSSFSSPESQSALVQSLGGDADPAVREAAADAVASQAALSGELVLGLESAFQGDPSEAVRAHAGRALAAALLLEDGGEASRAASVESGLRTLAEASSDAEARSLAEAGLELLSRAAEVRS
ncbi:MAG: HEAT repeat domain-containing protein [Planctomycetes bacterium]|nr:HEAT repeat domain-containing protein [Planctomycetota bacterium]